MFSRLKNLITPAKEALSKKPVVHKDVRPENLLKAKEIFQEMKIELKNLIQSLFPDLCENIIAILGVSNFILIIGNH